ncbi:MAG: ABC transporter ATP-binding protein [Anaerolineae bacterium]|nr:ABC transporter ATP-binding protein [Anaerolineae bacterium]
MNIRQNGHHYGGGEPAIAVHVADVYKAFGKERPLRERFRWRRNGHNQNEANSAGDEKAESKVTVAVNHVSFDIRHGEIFGVLGPNGSGKSTLIRLMATLLLPDEGTITIFGHDVEREPMVVQRMLNRVSVEASFFKKLSPMENLLYGARLYGLEGGEVRQRVLAILDRLDIPRKNIYEPMDQMSRGMQQKVAVARALLSSPRLLLLDEPTTGLDPRSKREVQAFVRELREEQGTTILLTTHDMEEAEKLCDRIAIMDSGAIVALDTPTALKQLVPQNGHQPTLEDVFLELTGKKLVKETDEPA